MERRTRNLTASQGLTEEIGSFDELASGQCVQTSCRVVRSFVIEDVAAGRWSSAGRADHPAA